MKRGLLAVVLLLAMMFALVGCNSSPFQNKPEDVIEEFLSQDSLMEIISRFDDFEVEEDGDMASLFWSEVLTSSSMKSLLLDNVRSIDYSITDVSETSYNAEVTAMITHLDITPIADKAFELLIDKINSMDAAHIEVPEDEDEAAALLMSLLKQSIREAIASKKPSETFTKVRFELTKDPDGFWEMDEMPDDFLEKVLLMNLQSAFEDGSASLDIYSNYG